MNLSKIGIALFLVFVVAGFSLSTVSAKPETFTNTMELNKKYYLTDLNTAFWDTFWDDSDEATYDGSLYQILSGKGSSSINLVTSGIVKYDTEYNIGGFTHYYVIPLVAGTYTTVTHHKVAGDKTYIWNFVDTGYGQ